MTLPSSGTITSADIRSELRLGASDQFTVTTSSSNLVNWLAGQNGTQVSMPSELYSKSAYKFTEVTSFSSLGTSHSFSSVNFGADFTGRRIQIIVECRNKASATTSGWNFTSILIGGASVSNASPYFYQGGSGSTLFFGLGPIAASPSGSSGTVSFNSTQQTQCRLFVLSIANANTLTDTGTAYASSSDPVTVSGGVTCASNGLLIAASISYKASGTVTSSGFTGGGWDEIYDAVTGGPLDFCTNISVKNRQSSGSKTVSCSWSGGTPNEAIVIALARE